MSEAELNPWHVVQRETKFDCPYFQVWQDTVSHAGGQPRPYNSVRVKFFGVAVAAIDAAGRVPLVGQYRHVLDRYTWEIPGGGALAGANPLATAKAELKEEIGCTAGHFLKIVEGSASPGTTNEFGAGFVAWGLEEGNPCPDPEETLLSRRVLFAEAVAMALKGEIGNMLGIAVLLGIHARSVQGDLPQDLLALLSG
jgi:8-oxo-dGTP pyrophosphatase MutT (NUDIX family)